MKKIDLSKGPVWEQAGISRYDYVRLPMRKKIKIMRRLAGVGFWEGLWRDVRWYGWQKWRWKFGRLDIRPLLNAYNAERAERQRIWRENPGAYFDENDKHYR